MLYNPVCVCVCVCPVPQERRSVVIVNVPDFSPGTTEARSAHTHSPHGRAKAKRKRKLAKSPWEPKNGPPGTDRCSFIHNTNWLSCGRDAWLGDKADYNTCHYCPLRRGQMSTYRAAERLAQRVTHFCQPWASFSCEMIRVHSSNYFSFFFLPQMTARMKAGP